MDKKGLTKFSFVVLGLVALIVFIASISYSTSFEGIKNQNYLPGESVKFDFSNQNYYLKIITPTTSFVRQGEDDKFSFKLTEKGKYAFYVTINGETEINYVFVGVEDAINNSLNIPQYLINESFKEFQLDKINKTEFIKSANKKEVKIYPNSNIDFQSSSGNVVENITVSTKLNMNIKEKEKIKILWKEKNQYVDFDIYENEDGFIQNISWNVNYLEVQTFEIIILITKAEHLDENRTFISDIYEQVRVKDDIWSQEIVSGEYTRIQFEKNLTKLNDITIFPRVISGNPVIEVYEVESNLSIANFSNINNNSYNKVYLTNLQSKYQDVFDLRILGGVVAFDHILDPTPKSLPPGGRSGMFVALNSTSQNPNYFIWNGSNWGDRQEALAVGGVPEWLSIAAGPVRDEYILVSADNVDDTNIQMYYVNSSGQKCWGNGTACGVVWEVNITSTAANVKKADVAYSHISGDALTVWSDNSRRPLFSVWNGSYWSIPKTVNDSSVSNIGALSLTGTNIETVNLAPRTNNSDEIALLLTDSNDDAEVIIWNGTGFYCESPVLSTSVGTTNVQKADLDYEYLSGDLFVATILSATSFNISTKAEGTCTFVGATRTVLNAVWMDVAAQPGTDNVMLVGSTGGGTDDMNAQVWRGSVWGNVSAEDTTVYAAGASPNQFFAAAWAGLKTGLVVYSDAANTLVDWFHFNPVSMAWQAVPAVDFTPTPLFSPTGESNIKAYSFIDENKTFAFFKDANSTHSKMWAKIFDGETNSWIDTETGQQPLLWDSSNTNTYFPTFDFAWQRHVTPPAFSIVYPANTTYNSNISEINYTFESTSANCWYSIDDGQTNSSPSSTCSNFTDIESNEGSNTWTLFVNDSLGVWDSKNVTFFKDSIVPLIEFGDQADVNYSNKSSSTIKINITFSDTNIINATISLYNSTMHLFRNTSTSISPNLTQYTNLPDGIYYFNASVYDISFNYNYTETRQVLIDTTYPLISIVVPANATYTSTIDQLNYTFTDTNPAYCWYSIDNGENNLSILDCGLNFTPFSSPQGSNTWIVYINDSVGNENRTNVTFFVDSINPGIRFIPPTALNGTSRDDSFIYAEVELIEDNVFNVTYTLANSTQTLNVTTYSSSVTSINWTGLNYSNVQYFYNVSVYDVLGNYNDTGTRVLNLTLGDIAAPDIFFNIPLFNGFYFNYSDINLNITVSEEANTVRYSFNYGQTNYSMRNLTLFDYNSSVSLVDGFYELMIFANDSIGNLGKRSRNFTVDTIIPNISYGVNTVASGVYVSRDWIYVNVSAFDINEAIVNFSLFNEIGLVNSTEFVDGTREINWTGLSNDIYFYNITLIDLAGNINYTETRNITLDTENPSAYLNLPSNNSAFNSVQHNLTVNSSDNFVLSNLTLFIYNISNDLINQTVTYTDLIDSSFGVVFNFPYNGNFTWNYIVLDKAGNQNITELNTITIDSIGPNIEFAGETESNNTEFERNWIYANVSSFDLNFMNLTYYLYNSTDLINETSFDNAFSVVNWTDLLTSNITYFYNATAYDLVGNFNKTETRKIKLIDITNPTLEISSPLNKTYYVNTSLPLIFSVSDVNLDSCWYNLDNGPNNTLLNCDNDVFNVSEGSHVLYLFANDSLNLKTVRNVTFVANESLLPKMKGILAYSEGNSAPSPIRYRTWDGTSFSGELSALTVGVLGEWISVKSAPSRDEHMMVIANSVDDVSVQINSTLQNGTSCWHNGTTCNNYMNLTITSTIINRQKADLAYETSTGDAIVVYSQNNATLGYKVWNGTFWSNNLAVPQTLMDGGVISYVKMASNPNSDEIALIMTNTSSLNVIIWNGTEWGCEPSSLRSNVLTPDLWQHADLAYEQNSGDLFVASTVNGGSDIDYTTKQSGSCSYTTTRTTTMVEEGEIISVAPRYDSDYIMITQEDISGTGNSEDLESIVWDGSQMLARSGNEITAFAATSPNIPIAPVWVGTSDHGLAIYSDAATSLNIDYFRYNVSNNAWEGGTAGLNAVGATNFGIEEQNIKTYSFIERNRSMLLFKDDNDDLWAKYYDGDTNTFGDLDSGATFELTVSSTTFPAFDFDFNNDRAGPDIDLLAINDYINESNVLFNISTKEDAITCIYSLNGANNLSLSKLNPRKFYSTVPLTDGNYQVIFTCDDLYENARSVEDNFVVDTVNPLIMFNSGTAQNDSELQTDFVYINSTLIELNIANITYEIHNTTHIVNRTTFNTSITNINFTGLDEGIYFYNISVFDLANRYNKTETRKINLTRTSPIINLIYPENNTNITGYLINQFNFSVMGNSSIANCSLYGSWNSWNINQTIYNPSQFTVLNFSLVDVGDDGYYHWNVYCYDSYSVQGYGSTNYTFASFLPPEYPVISIFNQTNNDGTGNISLSWPSSPHAEHYNIYYSNNVSSFVLLNQTNHTSYNDSSFAGNKRRFYSISAWNPIYENYSLDIFAAQVYTLSQTTNTRNWIGFIANSSLFDASEALDEIRNITAVTMWNATVQRAITCNDFSCPNFPACTETNCNFNIAQGTGYEINLNSSVPVNWSSVGKVYSTQNMTLIKNSTSSGKNWIAIYPNSKFINAQTILGNVSRADAITRWNAQTQSSQGLIPSPLPFGPRYIGTNFTLSYEEGYEISVNQTINMSHI